MAGADLLAYFIAFALLFASSTMGVMDLPLLVLNVLGGTGQQVGIIVGGCHRDRHQGLVVSTTSFKADAILQSIGGLLHVPLRAIFPAEPGRRIAETGDGAATARAGSSAAAGRA